MGSRGVDSGKRGQMGGRRPTEKQRAFAAARLGGKTQDAAAAVAGYSSRTDAATVEAACIALGILPDPDKETDELRSVVASLEDSRREGREWLCAQIAKDRDGIYAALKAAAEDGNVTAIKEVLDRYLGPEKGQMSATVETDTDDGVTRVVLTWPE